MEKMEESIAYEMAMLAKENRELRARLKFLDSNNTELCRECDNLRETIRNMKEEAKVKKEKPVYELYDAPHNLRRGCHIVITEVRAKDAKFPKGFILQANTIAKNAEGIVTIKGEYQRLFKSWSNGGYCQETGRNNTTINNKFYNWKVSDAAGLSTISELNGWDNPEYIGIIEQ